VLCPFPSPALVFCCFPLLALAAQPCFLDTFVDVAFYVHS
jgi:hypothetical protein